MRHVSHALLEAALDYSGKKGNKHFMIKSWNGPWSLDDLKTIKKNEGVLGDVKFEGIGSFNHDKGYLFNTGNLLWSDKDWHRVVSDI